MRIVAALGGNALLRRGEPPASDLQAAHVQVAAAALAALAADHELVVTHGNGPQVGMLAIESENDQALSRPYPLDVLVAETQGMIGYLLTQALGNALPGRAVAGLVCQTLVDEADPAFGAPTKFVGPVYDEAIAERLAAAHGWSIRHDGRSWRRVVASPEPLDVVELPAVRALLGWGAVVVCAGGGGAPVVRETTGGLRGIEAVVDKDLVSALVATALRADLLVILTDVEGVFEGFGTPQARLLREATPATLRGAPFPEGSMGPKVDAACRFVEATGGRAAIGRLEDTAAIVRGDAGTNVAPDLATTA